MTVKDRRLEILCSLTPTPPLRKEPHTSSENVCDTFTIRIDLLFADNFTLTLYYDDHKRHHVCLFYDMPRTSPGNKPGLGNVSRKSYSYR